MLCYEDYHITHKNRNFKFSLHFIPSCHMELFSGGTQQTAKKSILHPKEKSIE
jgi:hypothetical protein